VAGGSIWSKKNTDHARKILWAKNLREAVCAESGQNIDFKDFTLKILRINNLRDALGLSSTVGGIKQNYADFWLGQGWMSQGHVENDGGEVDRGGLRENVNRREFSAERQCWIRDSRSP
jgi:hypothetical protein